MYVPYFSVHLVFISKLLITIDCLVIIWKSICLIVQTSNFKMIGVAKQHHGLFHLQDFSDLNSFSKDFIVNATDSSMLWHSRLGHTSNKVLHQLCSQYNEISFDSFHPCDTCHYAKQKKLPFPVLLLAQKFFELIHVDIWGSYSIPSFEDHRFS